MSGLGGMTAVAAGPWNGHAATTTGEETTTEGSDRLAQVLSVSAPEGRTRYTYDRAGNRLSLTRRGSTTTWSYDQADRFRLTTGYHVDPHGNVTISPASRIATTRPIACWKPPAGAPCSPPATMGTACARSRARGWWAAVPSTRPPTSIDIKILRY
ncbi:MAG: hypothetical protein K6W08_16160 [Firmicutes bacterium]|nr:hypothetical protein [Bacillota bacterium]